MFIARKWNRTESDDFKLNMEPYLGPTTEAVAQYSKEGTVVGWKIQGRYE